MKISLDIQDDLLVSAKARAAHERSTLTALIEDGLRLRLRKPERPDAAQAPRLPVHRGRGGLMPGVDPTSNRSMFEAADGDT